jgi:hypothetical protein
MSRASRACGAMRLASIVCILLSVMGCSDSRPQNSLNACAYQSIQAAIDAAPSGGRVLICDGVHNEAVTVRKPLTLFGVSRDRTVLTGGGAQAIVTIEGVAGSVVVQQLTLRPPPGSSATRTAVHVAASRNVTLSGLSVDFHGVVALSGAEAVPTPEGDARPVSNGFIGIDVETSTVELKASTIQSVGPRDYVSSGVRIRGLSTVHIEQVDVNHSGGPAIQSSDSDVLIKRSTISRSVTDGVDVLSGFVQIFDSTIDAVERDGLVISGGLLRSNRVNITAPLRYGALAAGGLLELNQTRIENSGDGIHDTLGVVVASETVIQNARGFGLYAHDSGFIVYDKGSLVGGSVGAFLDFQDAYIALLNKPFRNTQDRGVELRDGQLLISGGSIVRASQEGVRAEGGELLLDAVTVENSRTDGIVLTGVTDASLDNVTVQNNAGFGVVCDGGTMGLQSKVKLEVCIGHFRDNAQSQTHLFNGCQILYTCTNLGS